MIIESHFKVETQTNSIIPIKAIEILPFAEEAISEWTENTDLNKFLFELYNGTGYGSVAIGYFVEAKHEFQGWALLFEERAKSAIPSPGSINQDISIPDFMKNKKFGLLSKSMSAWDNLISNILAEASYFSLPHILETRTDLTSSIHLSAHLFYRQAFQVLRNFIESLILPMHFCDNTNDYQKWKNNDYRTPSLRGNNGLLDKLFKKNIITEEIKNNISDLYKDLNGYIHGSEDMMHNKGTDSGEWAGFVFQENEYNKWITTFSSCIEIGIQVLRQHHIQWETIKERDNLHHICTVCHSDKIEIINTDSLHNITTLKCLDCKQEFSRDLEENNIITTTIEFE